MSLHLKLVHYPLTFEESKLRQIEAHAFSTVANKRQVTVFHGIGSGFSDPEEKEQTVLHWRAKCM